MEQQAQRPSDEGDLKTSRQGDDNVVDGGETAAQAQRLGPADADYDVETVERVYRFVVECAATQPDMYTDWLFLGSLTFASFLVSIDLLSSSHLLLI
jgi:hypothetical protein